MNIITYDNNFSNNLSDDIVIFLAGPTVRGNQQHLTSWRFDAIKEFKKQKFNGVLVVPEFKDKTKSDKGKEWIPLWEFERLKVADCIMFWIPRTKELIGLTTNFEIGYWIAKDSDKVVYGRPNDAYRMDYIDIMWNENTMNAPIYNTLEDTVKESIKRANILV